VAGACAHMAFLLNGFVTRDPAALSEGFQSARVILALFLASFPEIYAAGLR